MMPDIQSALSIKVLTFSFACPDDWDKQPLQLGYRLRGVLGLTLKQACCFFNDKKRPCEGCDKRAHCHYGQQFETPKNIYAEGFGNMPSLPHAWRLSVDIVGVRVQASLTLAGMGLAYETSWKAVIDVLPFEIIWQPSPSKQQKLQNTWLSCTPLRLKLKGKVPNSEPELAAAIANSIVAKSRMLAAWHGLDAPQDFLPEPTCHNMQWCESSRYAFRAQTMQSMGGWLCRIEWADDIPASWLPWLQLAYVLGVGKQTSFGLGRFS